MNETQEEEVDGGPYVVCWLAVAIVFVVGCCTAAVAT